MRRLLNCFLCMLTISTSTPASADANSAARLPSEAFGQCQFSIVETEHVKLETASDGSSEYSYCDVSLSIPSGLSGEPLDISILDRGVHESKLEAKMKDGLTENGFVSGKNGTWLFLGTEFLLPPSKMLSTSLIDENIDGETILVGHQLLRGYISQGGPIRVPGIRILRITPVFTIRVSLNFHSIDSERPMRKRLREAVSKELVDVIKSVQYRPGLKGPTVRTEESRSRQ